MKEISGRKELTRGLAALLCAGTLLAGCTWVELSEEAEAVKLAAEAPANCERIGGTTSMTKSDIASIDRNRDKVATELATLARNAAARMGGDTVVAETEVSEAGEQAFGIYRCGG